MSNPSQTTLETASSANSKTTTTIKSDAILSKAPVRGVSRKDLKTEDLLLGGLPWLFNKDGTRYGGAPVVPKHIREIKDDWTRNIRIDEFLKKMDTIPLTEEDKQQEAEWHELLLGPHWNEPLDDDIADAVIAEWHGTSTNY